MLDNEEIYESYEKRIRDRLAAEEELDAMDAKRRQREMEQDYNLERVNRFEQQEIDEEEEMEEENLDEGADRPLNLEQFECPLREWIAEERTRREIKRRFKIFLSTYYDGIEAVEDFRRHHGNAPLPPQLAVKKPIYTLKIR
jgi:CO dehydrogenase/acetyl-CoA synthase beta subunit